MPEGTGNSKSEHGSVGKGNGTDAKGNKSDGSKGGNVNDTKYGGLGGWGGSSLGGTKKAGNSTVADMMIAEGKIVAPSIGPNGMAQGNYPSKIDAYNDYASAVGDYATRSWAGKIADFFGGSWYDQQSPISQNPRTFAQGTYHTSTNPAGALIGAATPYGMGVVTGPIAANVYNGLGGKNIFHGGYSQPDTGAYSDPSGGWSSTAQSSGGATGGGQNSVGYDKGGQGGAIPGILNVPPQQAPSTLLPNTQAQPGQQQANLFKKQNYALGLNGVPGPSPYNYQTAWWL